MVCMMLVPFSRKAQLLRAVRRLALYNDKGVYWSKHSEQQARSERAKTIARIEALVSKIGKDDLPPIFITALKSGALSTDITGKYVDALRNHFRRESAA